VVFEAISQYRPPKLYIAVDGARRSRPGEEAAVEAVKALFARVDWPCEVHQLYRNQNLGCKQAISSAITWFFEREEKGVILEDDCVPSLQFFDFAEKMLDYCKDDPKVFAVQGNCFSAEDLGYSYYYSRNFFMWGWATWADRWRAVRFDTPFLTELAGSRLLAKWPSKDSDVSAYWREILDRQIGGNFDSWGYPTTFNIFARQQVNVTPAVNLVRNIGFDSRATHTGGMVVGDLNNSYGELRIPIVHCPRYFYPRAAERAERTRRIQIQPLFRLRRWALRNLPGLFGVLRGLKATLG
jgi:hypothetical protein